MTDRCIKFFANFTIHVRNLKYVRKPTVLYILYWFKFYVAFKGRIVEITLFFLKRVWNFMKKIYFMSKEFDKILWFD